MSEPQGEYLHVVAAARRRPPSRIDHQGPGGDRVTEHSGEIEQACLLRHPEDCWCDEGMFATNPVGHLAVVRWEDTTNIAAWQDMDDLRDFASNGGWLCENVGWVQVSNEDCIVLSARRTVKGEPQRGLTERIPRRAIISIRRADISGSSEQEVIE